MGSTAIIYAAVAVACTLVGLVIGRVWGSSNVKSRVEEALENERKFADAREYTIREQLDEKMAEVARLQPLIDEVSRLRMQAQREKLRYEQTDAGLNLDAQAAGSSGSLINSETSESVPNVPRPPEAADLAIQKLLQSLEATLQEPADEPAIPVEETDKKMPAVQTPAAVKPAAAPPPRPAPAPESRPTAVPRPVADPRPVSVSPPRPVPPRPIAVPQQVAEPRPTIATRPVAAPQQTAPPQPKVDPRSGANPRSAAPPQPAAKADPKPGPNSAVDEWQEFARSLAALTQSNNQRDK